MAAFDFKADHWTKDPDLVRGLRPIVIRALIEAELEAMPRRPFYRDPAEICRTCRRAFRRVLKRLTLARRVMLGLPVRIHD